MVVHKSQTGDGRKLELLNYGDAHIAGWVLPHGTSRHARRSESFRVRARSQHGSARTWAASGLKKTDRSGGLRVG